MTAASYTSIAQPEASKQALYTQPTRLATGVVCHTDTQQNKPYKIPWPCQGLNRGPTALHPSVHPSIHPCVRPSVHPSIHPSIHLQMIFSFARDAVATAILTLSSCTDLASSVMVAPRYLNCVTLSSFSPLIDACNLSLDPVLKTLLFSTLYLHTKLFCALL